MHVNTVVLAQRNICARGFEFGRSSWVAERLESLMLFLLVFVLAKVHFVAF